MPKVHRKNIKFLLQMCSLEEVFNSNSEDLMMLIESEEGRMRKGNFDIMLPKAQNFDYYSQLFLRLRDTKTFYF